MKTALETNIDLRSTAIDIAITEKQLMAALGAYGLLWYMVKTVNSRL